MRSGWRLPFLVILVGAAVGCAPGTATTPTPKPRGDRAASPKPADQAPGTYTGRVLGVDGKPAADVRVRGFLVSDAGASIVSNNGGAVVADNRGGLITDNGAGYRLAAGEAGVGLETRTDADGRFALKAPDGEPLNLEADAGDALKAIRFGVAADARGVDLQLAPTGTLRGRVTAPTAPGVTDFEGVDVFVPGTAYLAKTDKAGNFAIPNMAQAAYELVARHPGLGQARVQGVQVASNATATAPDLALAPNVPAIAALEPPVAAPGATLTIRGERFGASSGATFEVTVAGVKVADPKRPDDRTIEVKVPAVPASGAVVVSVAGVASAGKDLVVLKDLAIELVTTELLVGATRAFPLRATDVGGKAVADVPAAWSIAGDAATVDARTGAVTAGKPGVATLRAAIGDVVATLELRVSALVATVATLAGTGEPGDLDGPAAAARFGSAVGLALDGTAGLLVLDGQKLRRVDLAAADKAVSTLAGGPQGYADGPAATAQFNYPNGLDARGGVAWIAEFQNKRVRRVALGEAGLPVSTVAGAGGFGSADGAALAATFGGLADVAAGADGTVYVADPENHRIRVLSPDGQVSTLAGDGAPGPTGGAFADGPSATARFADPHGLALDPTASPPVLYVTDPANARVRRITLAPAGATVETLAGTGQVGATDGPAATASFTRPWAIALDAARGRLFVGDGPQDRPVVRMIDLKAAGRPVVTLAGGPIAFELGQPVQAVDGAGRDARFGGAADLAVGPDGTLYVADQPAHRLRAVTIQTAP